MRILNETSPSEFSKESVEDRLQMIGVDLNDIRKEDCAFEQIHDHLNAMVIKDEANQMKDEWLRRKLTFFLPVKGPIIRFDLISYSDNFSLFSLI